jgi:phosphate:Na+ symporter
VGYNFYDVTFVRWFKNAPTTQIAMFHTFFNVICTLLFLPFTKHLVKLSELLIREKKKTEKESWELVYMDKRFLNTPAVALGQLNKETFRMADMSMESLQTAFGGFINRDLEAIDKVYEVNENVARISEQISNYLVQTSACGLSLSDEKLVSRLHSNIGDIARIAELADNLTKYTKREVKDNLVFSEGINEKLEKMHALLHEQYALVKRIVLEKENGLVEASDKLEEEIDTMRRDLVAEHIERLGQGKCRPENNTIFVNLVCNLERIGDHLNFIVHSIDE